MLPVRLNRYISLLNAEPGTVYPALLKSLNRYISLLNAEQNWTNHVPGLLVLIDTYRCLMQNTCIVAFPFIVGLNRYISLVNAEQNCGALAIHKES